MVKLSTLLNGWGLVVPTSSHLCPGLIRVPPKWSMPGLDTGQSSGPPQCPWRIGKRGQDHPTRIFGFWTFYVLWLNQFWTPHNYSCINTQSRLNCVVWDIWAEKGVWSVWKWDDGCVSLCEDPLTTNFCPAPDYSGLKTILSLLLYLESSWRWTQASSISSQCGLSTVLPLLTFVQPICWTRELSMWRMTLKVWTENWHWNTIMCFEYLWYSI